MNSDELNILIGSYKRVFNTEDGLRVLEDIDAFALIDEQVGSQLTHAECAYRNGMQDLIRYIKALISEEK